jgi:hypothetical protein
MAQVIYGHCIQCASRTHVLHYITEPDPAPLEEPFPQYKGLCQPCIHALFDAAFTEHGDGYARTEGVASLRYEYRCLNADVKRLTTEKDTLASDQRPGQSRSALSCRTLM